MSSSESLSWNADYDVSSINQYSFQTSSIPRLSVNNPEVMRRLKASLPVVITNSDMITPALKWNLGYLQKHMLSGHFFVYTSKDNRFKYYDYKRANKYGKSYPSTVKRCDVTFPQFLDMLKKRQNSKDKIYLQQTLNDSIGPVLSQDYLQFNWNLINKYKTTLRWGSLTSNLLLIGLEGNITPVHYDEQENFFTQLVGYKRCLLFSPDQFECLYPHPVWHPCDRQSQVDFEKPDFKRFPKFRNLSGFETVVGPGDVLYIPMYWWHQIESLTSLNLPDHGFSPEFTDVGPSSLINNPVPPVTISLNFWYRASPVPDRLVYPLTPQQQVSVMRNVEKLLAGALGNPDDVGKLLRTMVTGRYEEINDNSE